MRRGESKNREIFPAFSSYSLPYNSKMASWREKSRRKNLPKKSLPPKKFRQIFGARIRKKKSAVYGGRSVLYGLVNLRRQV